MKRLLVLAALLAVALPGTAGAAGTPCRNKVFNDWYRDGKIASSYPASCYRDALKHIPVDAGIYSSLSDDVRAALRAAQRRATGAKVPSQVGHGFKALGKGDVKGTLASIRSTSKAPHDPATGGGGSLADTASSAPLPILVLGGIALALVAAGGIGAGVRHARSRRQ